MELTIFQENLVDATKKLLKKYNLNDKKDYTLFYIEVFKPGTGNKVNVLKLQIENRNDIVNRLKKLNWRVDHIYYGDKLNTKIYSDDIYGVGSDNLIQLKYK